jgi:hypothetical protein
MKRDLERVLANQKEREGAWRIIDQIAGGTEYGAVFRSLGTRGNAGYA